MAREIWSRTIEGDTATLLIQETAHRLLVSTRRIEREAESGGLHWSVIHLAEPGSPGQCAYANEYAHRTYSFEPGGEVAWSHGDVNVHAQSPDGRLIAVDNSLERIVLGSEGEELHREITRGPRGVAGWIREGDGAYDPIVSRADDRPGVPPGTVWDRDFGYALFERKLHKFDASGDLLSSVPIPIEPFKRKLEVDGEWSQLPESFICPSSWDLLYDSRHDRLIATNWALPAWAMALGLDGTIQWLTLTRSGTCCCNFSRLLRDGQVIAHISSCGQRLTFMTANGDVFRAHDLAEPPDPRGFHAVGDGAVCVSLYGSGVLFFSTAGELLFTVEAANLQGSISYGDRLYLVTKTEAPRELRLAAFEIG